MKNILLTIQTTIAFIICMIVFAITYPIGYICYLITGDKRHISYADYHDMYPPEEDTDKG